MNVQENVSLAPYTTFKLGGVARYFIEAARPDDLGAALDYAETRGIPFFILAGGSNVLVSDSGFNGLVIKIGFDQLTVNTAEKSVTAEAGCVLMDAIREVATVGLAGMESMYGIPGTVGGAVRGNAGAFGTEVQDALLQATALNTQTREVRDFTNEECMFAYRNSFFKKNSEWVLLSATFTLQQEETSGAARAVADETLALRNERQIQDIQSAGSFFVNPTVHEGIRTAFEEEKGVAAKENRVPAGWLIEKSGNKGICESGVCTGERSANYIINVQAESAQAVHDLSQKVRNGVADMFGVELKEEVTLLGF